MVVDRENVKAKELRSSVDAGSELEEGSTLIQIHACKIDSS